MSIGSHHKKARQKKQVTIKEVFEQTRIHPDIISSLEDDKYDRISSTAYIRSFLKEYASYLGLNAQKILDEYNELHKTPVSDETHTQAVDIDEKSGGFDYENLFLAAKYIIGIIAVIIIVLLFFKGVFLIKERFNDRDLRKESIQKTEGIVIDDDAPVGKVKQPVQKKEPSEQIKDITIPKGERLTLSITVDDDTWVEMKVDGRIVSKNVLNKGTTETWQADENFEIWTGNAAAMHLELNGIYLGSPGRGVIKGVIIDRKGMRK
jgi:cytoskeletal protein RodZ